MKQKVALVGPGRVGSSITKHLYRAGYPVSAVIGRNEEKTMDACTFIGCPANCSSVDLADIQAAQIILIAVPDDQIKPLAEKIHRRMKSTRPITLIHFSGLHRADIMRHSSPETTTLLSLHPLLPFANRQSAFEQLKNCPCILEGDNAAMPLGKEIVKALGAQSFEIKGEKKVLYHAAACIASNFSVALWGWASELLETCDIDKAHASVLLSPLVLATLNNVTKYGPEQGLTGPIVRGDSGTIARHLEELKKLSPQDHTTYLSLAKLTLSLAEKSGRLGTQSAEQLHTVLANKPDER